VKRAAVLVALILAGCGGSSSGSSKTSTSATTASATTASASATTSAATTTSAAPSVTLASGFHLRSAAFHAGGSIPRTYTCDGRDAPLPLRWSGVPNATKELVLVMRDPDAPSGPFVHWAVAGISPSASTVPTRGVTLGRNSFGSVGYRGPCPPTGAKAHHYVLTLSALATPSGLRSGFSPDQLRSRALGIATLIGTYRRR
jgi:Raf kinase inhibitor-like YbhB/YbcL family protein